MKMQKLKIGDRVAIISPSGKVNKEKVLKSIKVINGWGLEVVIGKNAFNTFNKMAGTDQERLFDLQWAIDNPKVKAILCTRGGYGLVRIIDRLDWTKFKENPKWIIGFSDITVLHSVIHNLGFQSIHGPMLNSYDSTPKNVLDNLKELLFNNNLQYNNDLFKQNKVVGGNLCIIYSLLGTNNDIDTKGKILFLEDIDEYAYNVDRMLHALKKAKKLDDLKGLSLGYFTNIKDDGFGISIKQIILNVTKEYDYPIVFDIKAGHESNNYPILFG